MTAWINTRQRYSNAESQSLMFKHDQCATKKVMAMTKGEGMVFLLFVVFWNSSLGPSTRVIFPSKPGCV